MGAHTLGNAATDASGYRGAWIGGQTTDFNNVYYQFLTGAGVVFENAVRQIRTMESVRIGAGTLMDVFSGD